MDKNAVRQLAHDLMATHGLDGWTFEFRKFKGRLGQCKQGRVPGTGVISLSEFYVLLNEEWMVRDTLLHEIAHALVGPRHGHGPLWKEKARELGCIPRSCSKQARMPAGRYQAMCRICNHHYHMHRRPLSNRTYWCKQCGPDEGQLVFEKKQQRTTDVEAP
jgi:predicted SprT family Zn-dependent metalloprotease